MKELKDVQERYDFFPMIYEQGVKEYVPNYNVKEKLKKKGLIERIKELRRKGMKHGRKRKKRFREGKKTELTSNEYVRI